LALGPRPALRLPVAVLARRRLVTLAIGLALLALSGIAGSVVASGAASGAPCAVAAPLKHFDVQAIDVDITLNRFGDHDPSGKMYVLSNRVADVRAQETAALPNRVSIGLREDAIQPLVLRANEGDCVVINFTNNASGGPFGV